ncbi:MAG: hypothetical protein QOJ29_4333, partial [Thermoleophilaceae bacterium]|nr:hypothetical protein [Thermoleophilaceae bacterium]
VVRPFNTYGPRQSARAVIPTIIIQALAGDSIRLGSTEPVRDFTYVSDTVDGILAFAAAEASPGAVVQLGTGEAVSVAELVTLVGGVVGRELVVEQDPQRVRPIESEVAALVSDPKLAREAFGWEPAVSLREGLERTVEWIEAHSEHYPEPRLYAV